MKSVSSLNNVFPKTLVAADALITCELPLHYTSLHWGKLRDMFWIVVTGSLNNSHGGGASGSSYSR